MQKKNWLRSTFKGAWCMSHSFFMQQWGKSSPNRRTDEGVRAPSAGTVRMNPSRGSSQPEQLSAVIGEEGQHPGQRAHVQPLKQRPLPGIGLAPDNGNRADALQREHVK